MRHRAAVGLPGRQLVKQLSAIAPSTRPAGRGGSTSERAPVPQESFQLECDRLSHIVDGALFERLRWERNEGPMLARLVALAHSAFEMRPEFEMVEEGATRDVKRFVLKVHGNRVVGISLRIDGGSAHLEAHALDRSKYGLSDGGAATAAFEAVDEPWMVRALEGQFGRVQALGG
jgi:hypothetical protein